MRERERERERERNISVSTRLSMRAVLLTMFDSVLCLLQSSVQVGFIDRGFIDR